MPVSKQVASLNLCTDQLLLSLVPPSEIAGVSPLASDCAESSYCEAARSVPVIHPDGEALWLAQPSFILDGQFDHPFMARLAKSFKVPLYSLPPVTHLEDIIQQIQQVGRWSGHEEESKKLSDDFYAQLADIHPLLTDHPPTVAVLGDGGGLLLDDMLRHIGFVIVNPPQGVTVEYLLQHPPSLVVVSLLGEGVSLKEERVFPSVLKSHFKGIHHLIIPARLTLCGTMYTLDALYSLGLAYDCLVMEKNP